MIEIGLKQRGISMRKSLIDYYLQQISSGHEEYLSKLCQHLSDRLLFVPTLEKTEKKGQEEKFSIVIIKEEHRKTVPIFTTQERLKTWCKNNARETTFISLLGADVCLSLDDKTWVVVDPDFENSVILQPMMVQKIAIVETFTDENQAKPLPDDEEYVIPLSEEQVVKPSPVAEEVVEAGPQVSSVSESKSAAVKVLETPDKATSDALLLAGAKSKPPQRKGLSNLTDHTSTVKSTPKEIKGSKKSFLSFLKTGRKD